MEKMTLAEKFIKLRVFTRVSKIRIDYRFPTVHWGWIQISCN